MIGGLVAMTLDRSILRQLGTGRRTVVVTGTNGKSTTTRMTAAALRTLGGVATNAEGANMDAGLVAALAADRGAALAVLEVDEMHVPHVADAVEPAVVILLNLSRDQLDRVGEINVIERRLRAGLAAHPNAVVVANCDDVLMTSAAYDHTNVVWVAAGGSWAADSVSCPRSGEVIVREQGHWYSTGADFKRPSPQWWFDDENALRPRRIGAADAAGAARRGEPGQRRPGGGGRRRAGRRSGGGGGRRVRRRRGRRAVPDHSGRRAHRANAVGQEPRRLAGSPVDGEQGCGRGGDRGQRAGARRRRPVLAVGCPLRAVRAHFQGTPVVAAGERGTDLAVRLGYADVQHTLVHDTMAAIASCPPGPVEVVANYTAFLQLQRRLARHG